jgi:glucokinase
MSKDHFAFPVLVGDIGGTNARFEVFEGPDSPAVFSANVQNKDSGGLENTIKNVVLAHVAQKPKTAIFAGAGPVTGDTFKFTNIDHWDAIDLAKLRASAGFDDLAFLNDFEAQALAVAALPTVEHIKLGGGDPLQGSGRVVMGPGTGLGVAGLIQADGRWVPVPGEGGHVDVGPRSTSEERLFKHLEAIDGRISAEQVLCGSGLVNLYRASCYAAGDEPLIAPPPAKGQDHSPHEKADQPRRVSEAGLADPSSAAFSAHARDALQLFAMLLGRVAGDMALVFMARGGVYLAGGISQKISSVLSAPGFRAAFNDKAPHSELMASIPVFIVNHPTAALVGLATFARHPERFSVNLAGKRWRG